MWHIVGVHTAPPTPIGEESEAEADGWDYAGDSPGGRSAGAGRGGEVEVEG